MDGCSRWGGCVGVGCVLVVGLWVAGSLYVDEWVLWTCLGIIG